jgi:hypothetical protein
MCDMSDSSPRCTSSATRRDDERDSQYSLGAGCHEPVAENLQLVFSGRGAFGLGSNLAHYDTNLPVHRAFAGPSTRRTCHTA